MLRPAQCDVIRAHPVVGAARRVVVVERDATERKDALEAHGGAESGDKDGGVAGGRGARRGVGARQDVGKAIADKVARNDDVVGHDGDGAAQRRERADGQIGEVAKADDGETAPGRDASRSRRRTTPTDPLRATMCARRRSSSASPSAPTRCTSARACPSRRCSAKRGSRSSLLALDGGGASGAKDAVAGVDDVPTASLLRATSAL